MLFLPYSVQNTFLGTWKLYAQFITFSAVETLNALKEILPVGCIVFELINKLIQIN